MNVQSFYEYVVMRDILAFILPGSITLGGIYMVVEAYGVGRIERYTPFISQMNSVVSAIFFLLVAFLVGHIWDMLYRLLFQVTKQYQREDTYIKLLVGDPTEDTHSPKNHIAAEIREAAGEFLKINWEKTSINDWIASGKIFEASVLLSYWIEEEDPKLFGSEIGRPITQSHFLHSVGMAFMFLGIACIPLTAYFSGVKIDVSQDLGFITFLTLSIVVILFGWFLIKQGIHKRGIFLEHVFRVFYVVWRKRTLENESRKAGDKFVRRPK